MCGIAAIINQNGPVDRHKIEAMTDAVRHRGPDSSGYFLKNNFAFGHRRLAIIDLSPTGSQPMHYLDRYTIITNGEIYNYLELRDELKKQGYSFKSQSDTEVILASYDMWGPECVKKFNGMWAFAIYDSRQNTIFCSRDRFGIKPFYYSRFDGRFHIASEIKQFTTQDGWRAKLNHSRAHDFLLHGIRNHTPETVFKNVYQLPGGYNLTYDLASNRYAATQWYDPEKAAPFVSLDFADARERFLELFTDSIRLRLRSDVKVGSCLSGGLDSSSIVCTVNDILRREKAQDKQETVTSCFDIKEYDEQQYVDEVARRTGIVTHRVYPRFEDLFECLDKIIWHQDEPFGSTSIFAQWEVFKGAADNKITVMLDGQGADELLGGYHIFYGKFLAGLALRLKFLRLLTEMHHIKKHQGWPLAHIFRILLGNLPPSSWRRTFRSLTPNEISATLIQKQSDINPEPWQKPTRTMRQESLAEIRMTHLPILLQYEDRNSMAHSIESRVPFLDYRLVEFALGLPDTYKIDKAATKYILRDTMKDRLPESIINRYDKMGFVTPEEIWIKKNGDRFRNELEAAVNHSGGLINKNIMIIFDAMLEDRRKFDFTVWRFISFGRWLKKFNVAVGD